MGRVLALFVFITLQFHSVISASFQRTVSDFEDLSIPLIPAEALNPTEFEEAKLLEVEDHSKRRSNFYESEVLYGKSFQEAKDSVSEMTRNGLVDDRKRWPKVGENVVIPYIISSKYTAKQRQAIAKAFDNFHETTCLRFVPRSTQRDYINIIPGIGCDSDAGRIGGEQAVSLGPGCEYTDIAIHELNHAVGFWHEQNRPDRDNYVTVYLQNVKPENRFNFDKMNQRQINSFGVEYDTDSIMHYDKYAFSKDPQKLPVMEPKIKNDNMGLAKILSKSDIKRIQKMYKCEIETSRKKKFFRNLRFSQQENDTDNVPDFQPDFQPAADFHHAENCKDLHEDCSKFKQLTTCEENAWMRVTCREACNTCANPCQDIKTECSSWAANGACSSHSGYMQLYCPKSCQLCQPNQD